MPGFASAMDDRQVAALARFLRSNFTGKPPWTDIESSLGDARAALRASGGKPGSGSAASGAQPGGS
jgi:mono/diheme cytochrome c family protein